jgi:hypothetical protein
MSLIKKVRNVGDAHPSKPWIWTEYAPGKFDWRAVKKTTKKDAPASEDGKKTTTPTPSKLSAKQSEGKITAVSWWNDPAMIQKKYPNIYNDSGKIERITFDRVLDMIRRRDPKYQGVKKTMEDLAKSYNGFITNPGQTFMISAGGAGIDKSYLLEEIMNLNNKIMFDPDTMEMGSVDYDWVEVFLFPSPSDFLETLQTHNGKIIVFDDPKSNMILTRKNYGKALKEAAGKGARKRIVHDTFVHGGATFEFTGKIIIITNKDMHGLRLEGGKAFNAIENCAGIISDVKLTMEEAREQIREIMPIVKWRNRDIDPDPEIDKQERQMLLDALDRNFNNIDPMDFSFQNLIVQGIDAIRSSKRLKKGLEENSKLSEFFKDYGTTIETIEEKMEKKLDRILTT